MRPYIPLILFLLIFTESAYSVNPQCPTYTPPTTTTASIKKYYNGQWDKYFTSAISACLYLAPRLQPGDWSQIPPVVVSDTNTSFSCRYTRQSDNETFTSPYQWSWFCPTGYSQDNYAYGVICTLQNPDSVPCYSTCSGGTSVGMGGVDNPDSLNNPLACFNGCVIKPRGMSASKLDNAGTSIGIQVAEWEQTGTTCTTQGGSLPISNDIGTKPNCVSNGARELCLSTTKPGCGIVNGKEWCPDQVGCGTVNGVRVCVPDDGGCTPVGGLDFACTKNATPKPAPANEPPPVVDFKAQVPVQNAQAPTGGTPTTGAVPRSGGSDTGGQAPVIIGHYPGNSGNGTIQNPITQGQPGSNGTGGTGSGGTGGTGTIDTSGLAQESSLQSLGGLVTQIRDSLGGSVSGSAFTATTPVPHDNVNINPDITSKQTELSTKLAQVKAEFGQLLSFGSSTNAQALQCPANSGFTFYGTTISLCTQSVLSATATIGNVLIFLAFVVSLFILLS